MTSQQDQWKPVNNGIIILKGWKEHNCQHKIVNGEFYVKIHFKNECKIKAISDNKRWNASRHAIQKYWTLIQAQENDIGWMLRDIGRPKEHWKKWMGD